jgi:hypothetical protein
MLSETNGNGNRNENGAVNKTNGHEENKRVKWDLAHS